MVGNKEMVKHLKKMLMEKSYEDPFAQPSCICSWPILTLIINLSTEQYVLKSCVQGSWITLPHLYGTPSP